MGLYNAKYPVFVVTVFMVTKTVKFLFEMNNPYGKKMSRHSLISAKWSKDIIVVSW